MRGICCRMVRPFVNALMVVRAHGLFTDDRNIHVVGGTDRQPLFDHHYVSSGPGPWFFSMSCLIVTHTLSIHISH